MTISAWLSLLIMTIAVTAVFRGVDVRLALLTGAFCLAVITGDTALVIRTFLSTFSNEQFVVPICSAMGFAYVMKQTGCDQHLVRLLLHPLRYVRALLIPGVILVGFLINIPVISQTSTAVCLGTVVVPLLRAAGYTPITIGATLLLGTSIGGELLNPGAPELLTISSRSGIPTPEMWPVIFRVVWPQLLFAGLMFWLYDTWISQRISRNASAISPSATISASLPVEEPIQLWKALVPLVPLALLFFTGPPLNLFPIAQRWVVERPPATATAAVCGTAAADALEMSRDPRSSSRMIGLVMLIGVVIAAASTPSRAGGTMQAFFEGAGRGFTQIVSLIVTANCFGTAIQHSGLATPLESWISGNPSWLEPLAAVIPAGFAMICGSGMASTQSLYGFFHGSALAIGTDPIAVGAMVALGSAAGRTISPVAAVVLMCAAVTETHPFDLIKRVGPPVMIALAGVVGLRFAGLV